MTAGVFVVGAALGASGCWLLVGAHDFAFLQTRSPPDSTLTSPPRAAKGTPDGSKDSIDPPWLGVACLREAIQCGMWSGGLPYK